MNRPNRLNIYSAKGSSPSSYSLRCRIAAACFIIVLILLSKRILRPPSTSSSSEIHVKASVASTDAGLLQRSVNVLTALFDRVGLKTNVAKAKVMTCVDARIRVRQSDEVYYNARHGFRSAKEWSRRRVECDKC
eukprot:scaffold2358_cov105-Skeletonema_dohrnii-CCMP3373.AAC.2